MDKKKQAKKFADKSKVEFGEDVTKYGENVSSLFRWIPIKEQKIRTEHLENVTKKE